MPPVSDRQQKAACADLDRLNAGEELVTFRGMSKAELEKMCSQVVKGPPKRGGKKRPM